MRNEEPFYIQIANELRNEILSGNLAPGDKIQSEMTLCDIYHVSRITIRKTLDILVYEKLITSQRAKGTFVINWQHHKEHYTMIKNSFTDEMYELGKEEITLSATLTIQEADTKIAKKLNIKAGDKVLVLKRLRGVDEQSFAYFISYFTYNENFSIDVNDYLGSFYELLKQFNIKIDKFEEYIEAILPPKEIQEVLKISSKVPVLKRVRMGTQKDGTFHEYTECFYIGDQYRYYIEFI